MPHVAIPVAMLRSAVEKLTSGRSKIADTRSEVSCDEGLNAVSAVRDSSYNASADVIDANERLGCS